MTRTTRITSLAASALASVVMTVPQSLAHQHGWYPPGHARGLRQAASSVIVPTLVRPAVVRPVAVRPVVVQPAPPAVVIAPLAPPVVFVEQQPRWRKSHPHGHQPRGRGHGRGHDDR